MRTQWREVPIPSEPIDSLPSDWVEGIPTEFVLGAGQKVPVLKIGLRSNPRSTGAAEEYSWPSLVPGDLTLEESEYLDRFLLTHGSMSGLFVGLHQVWATRWSSHG